MNAQEAFLHIQRTRIIAILRGPMLGLEIDLAESLVSGGITAMEVSTVTRGYVEIIRNLCAHFSSRVAIGAGTVVSEAHLRAAADAGASFIVSPCTDSQVIRETVRLGLASIPGAFTPTEVMLAVNSGAHAVKIFPASALGPSYIRALHGPFPDVKLVPTGGVRLGNLKEYLSAGSVAAGIGSELIGKSEFEQFDAAALARKARTYAEAARA